jgi:hypothetical protein
MNTNAVMVSIGDRVFSWKFVYDREYFTRGVVTERRWDKIHECYCVKIRDEKTCEMDWYNAENDLTHKFEILADDNKPMNHQQAVTELRRQLKTGEATRQQYERVIESMESTMIEMHAAGEFDVMGYARSEATANAYREALDLEPSSIREQVSTLSPTLTDADYRSAVSANLPQPSPRKSSGQLWEPCAKRGCDNEPSCLDCGYCLDKHCHCGE